MIGFGGLAPGPLDPLGHLAADLRRVGGPGAEDDLDARADRLDRVDEVDDPLLPGDPADEQDERLVRVDPVLRQDGRVGRRPVLVQVDAVVDDADLVAGDAVEVVDVVAHRLPRRR